MARLSTPLCDVLEVDRPIVQAPIGSLTSPALAAAVSNAGGLGTLAVTWRDVADTRAVIARTRSLTDRPFAVNLVLDDATRQRPTDEHLAACLEAGAPVISFSFGDPSPYVDRCRTADVPTVAMVGSSASAADYAAAGVDVLVAQGGEAGGHLEGDVSTMALVPRVVDAAPADVPVLAAGGVADGRGIAASLALGADGVWLGTRFVASEEADAHRDYKRAVAAARETATVRTDLFDGGWPGREHRTLATGTAAEWVEAGRPESGERPGEDERVAELADGTPVERYDDVPPVGELTGEPEALPHYAGQSAGLIGDVQPAGEILDRLVDETVAAVGPVQRQVDEA